MTYFSHLLKQPRLLLSVSMLVGMLLFAAWRMSSSLASSYQVAVVASTVTEEVGVLGNNQPGYLQNLELTSGQTTTVGSTFQPLSVTQLLRAGQQVIVSDDNNGTVQIVSLHRLPLYAVLLVLFVSGVLFVAGTRGWYAVVGMCFTIFVLLAITLPLLLQGTNAMVVALISTVLIGATTTYLTHGWHSMSHQTVLSLMLTLGVVMILSAVITWWAGLTGLGSDEAFTVQFLPLQNVDLRGLFLGGMLLGTLGILDDVIIAQVSVVAQLRENARDGATQLFWRSMRVGQDHLASLVNTLVVVYLGANLPLLVLLGISTEIPWWVMISNEQITEEIVRTLLGSLGIVLSVPLATALAVWWPHLKSTLARSFATSAGDNTRTERSPRSLKRSVPKATRIRRKTS